MLLRETKRVYYSVRDTLFAKNFRVLSLKFLNYSVHIFQLNWLLYFYKQLESRKSPLSCKMNANGTKSHGRTLWVWDTLPQKGLNPDDQSWLREGDAVENVHRLKLGNIRY